MFASAADVTHLKMPAAPMLRPLCAAASLALSSSNSSALRGSLGSMRCFDSHLLAAPACSHETGLQERIPMCQAVRGMS